MNTEKIELVKEKIKCYMNLDTDINQYNVGFLYDLWINDIISDRPNDDNYKHHLGVYYGYIRQNEKKMKKYLKPLVKKGNLDAIDDLAFYYANKGDKNKTIKYFKILIKYGDTPSMYNLGEYYEDIDNIKKTNKYYKMAFKKGYKIPVCH